jgi:FkbM family methyltransferase
MKHEWLKELKRQVERRTPGWLLAPLVLAHHLLHPRRPKGLVLLVGSRTYVRLDLRLFSPHRRQAFPDEDYFRILRPERGETVLDVGACIGFCAVTAARMVGREGLVVAVEPDLENLRWLRLNLGRLPNCVVIPKGVADREGRRLLHRHPIDPTEHTILDSLGGESVEIEVTTIDRICRELKLRRVDFMMMDIEGAELMALRGARRMLKRTQKVVVGAYHRVGGKPTWPRVKRFLEEMGFRTVLTEDGLVHAWKES